MLNNCYQCCYIECFLGYVKYWIIWLLRLFIFLYSSTSPKKIVLSFDSFYWLLFVVVAMANISTCFLRWIWSFNNYMLYQKINIFRKNKFTLKYCLFHSEHPVFDLNRKLTNKIHTNKSHKRTQTQETLLHIWCSKNKQLIDKLVLYSISLPHSLFFIYLR